MKRVAIAVALSQLLLWTMLLNVYHMGVLPPRENVAENGSGEFIPRSQAGLNHLILKGNAYTRGLRAGQLTQNLLLQQEEILISQLQTWIPHSWMLQLGIASLITYFYGADKFIAADDLEEMYGTSMSAPRQYDFMVDGYTRQLAYHGLHEVGQMMVDRGIDMGCTVVAVPEGKSWILGRNFDFEGGRIFDTEKLVKWVFPEKGFAHVSIIWAGMVGGVTGVNEKGVYISINAAGSEGYRRAGNPSTLVLYKVLKEASTAEEAAKIVQDAHMFITDIFVVMDSKGGLFRIEKSPQKTEIIAGEKPFAMSNHLTGKAFEKDKTNEWRKRELTSIARGSRALELAKKIPVSASASLKTEKVLEILRDKGVDEMGKPLHLGSRLAIDALIATHAVVMDGSRQILYVSQGPSLVGKFLGYDLAKSFATGKPVLAGELPHDPQVTDKMYEEFKEGSHAITTAIRMKRSNRCSEALTLLESLPEIAKNQEPYHHALGDVYSCLKRKDEAVTSWRKAYSMRPAYLSWRQDLERKLK